MIKSNLRVVVGLSGGVDSSVAALLLKEQGFDVVGLFMRNWNDAEVTLEDECPWIDDSRDAMLVAEKLGIPFQVIDLSALYKERIVDYMFREYEMGRTPNPDVLCNREIKFDVFLESALKLGADFVATGHYVRKGQLENSEYTLERGLDSNKDQSYFLCQLNQYQLSKALFPIGELEKSKVRELAKENDLITANKKDSQGLCFIGKVSLPEFLQQQLEVKKGRVIEVDQNCPAVIEYSEMLSILSPVDAAEKRLVLNESMGKIIGEHNGAHFYTRGQRRGLNIGGKPLPLFVLQTDIKRNIIYVGQGEDHRAMFYRGLRIDSQDVHWVIPSYESMSHQGQKYKCQIRYRQTAFECEIFIKNDHSVIVFFSKPQRNVTPGQFVTIFDGDRLFLSGVIAC